MADSGLVAGHIMARRRLNAFVLQTAVSEIPEKATLIAPQPFNFPFHGDDLHEKTSLNDLPNGDAGVELH